MFMIKISLYCNYKTLALVVQVNKDNKINLGFSTTCFKSVVRNCEKFGEQERQDIFKKFWNMTWEAKKVFVKGNASMMTT